MVQRISVPNNFHIKGYNLTRSGRKSHLSLFSLSRTTFLGAWKTIPMCTRQEVGGHWAGCQSITGHTWVSMRLCLIACVWTARRNLRDPELICRLHQRAEGESSPTACEVTCTCYPASPAVYYKNFIKVKRWSAIQLLFLPFPPR